MDGSEVTGIPIDGPEGWLGAAMYIATLCYPTSTEESWEKRTHMIKALEDWIKGYKKYRAGFSRLTKKRAEVIDDKWLTEPQSMKNERVFSALNNAENALRKRLIVSSSIERVYLQSLNARLSENNIGLVRFKVDCEESLTAEIHKATDKLGYSDIRSTWRLLENTKPVLHLVIALIRWRSPEDDGRPLIRQLISTHGEWLFKAVQTSERIPQQIRPIIELDASNLVRLVKK